MSPLAPAPRALSLLGAPLAGKVVLELADGTRSLADIHRQARSPAQSTLRGCLGKLAKAGIVERSYGRKLADGGYELTSSGRDLLEVAWFLSAWLATAPEQPLEIGTREEAREAVAALVDGWSSGMVRALVARPLSLTELNSVIGSITYPTLKRRLSAMRRLGLVEAAAQGGRINPYIVTDWLRRAIAPLAAAARWGRRHLAEEAPSVSKGDVEAAFLLSLPLLRLPESISGRCRLAVQMGTGGGEAALSALWLR